MKHILGLTPLLATAESNVAVDNIAMGLVRKGVRVVRVGPPGKIGDALSQHTLDYLVRQEVTQRQLAILTSKFFLVLGL